MGILDSKIDKEMKEILFIRHAKSDQTLWHTGIRDIERPLNERGRKDAALMHKVLLKENWKADAVFCSMAQRTRETLDLLKDARWINPLQVFFETDLYTFDAREVMSFIRHVPNDYSRIALIGHNPALTDVVEKLGNFRLDNLPTAGMVCVGSNEENWDDFIHKKGAVLWKAYPSEYRK
jgi:phosphohistidine phosphatase